MRGTLPTMPRSKTRQKSSRRPYVPPPPVKRRRPSPRWYGFVVLGLMALGVATIVWNYIRGSNAQQFFLWGGLGLIALGFAAATRWR